MKKNLLKISRRTFASSSSTVAFDKKLKVRQRDWSFNLPNSGYYDYLRSEIADRLIDRLDDISRQFPLALEIGCHRGHILKLLRERPNLNGSGSVGGIHSLIQGDISESVFKFTSGLGDSSGKVTADNQSGIKSFAFKCDEENLPFEDASFDIVLSNGYFHWVNDLPRTFHRIKSILRPDGVFIASMIGGDTLQELRRCFYLAEIERRGGISPHTSPFALPSDIAAIMQSTGFALPTIDVDTITVCQMKHL